MNVSLPLPPALPGAAAGSGVAPVPAPQQLRQGQKAAIIVKLLLSEGAPLDLSRMSEETQAALTREMSGLRLIDRSTLRSVVEEFAGELDSIGLSFPGGIEGALDVLEGHISPATAARLRREAGVAARGDPWQRLTGLAPERLITVLEEESIEVGAVLLAKLDVAKSADLLGRMPGARARQLSYAISKTGTVGPDTVRRIGLSLAAQLDAEPVRAFPDGPVQKVGDILNSARAAMRDEVLAGLEEDDADFAAEVKKAIFTFSNIPQRIDPRDIPKIVRTVDPATLTMALAYAESADGMQAAQAFVLDNMSKRMAENLRDEIKELGKVKADEGEAAMAEMVAGIRAQSDAGEILLLAEEPEEDA